MKRKNIVPIRTALVLVFFTIHGGIQLRLLLVSTNSKESTNWQKETFHQPIVETPPQTDDIKPTRHFNVSTSNAFASSSTAEKEKDWEFLPADSKKIRKWGCGRTETPFIFVHIGKAGGGSVRARLAASSHNYTRTKPLQRDLSFYPIGGSNETVARSCNSCFLHRRPTKEFAYEGTRLCQAKTPLGRAIGCPEATEQYAQELGGVADVCALDSDECRLVYFGHNIFGAEMHWLPGPYLSKWWSSRWGNNPMTPLFDLLHPKNHWCFYISKDRPDTRYDYKEKYQQCSIPLQKSADKQAIKSLSRLMAKNGQSEITSWAPVYSSMPVLRATLVRDPLDWILSKFLWHRKQRNVEMYDKCDDIDLAVQQGVVIPENQSGMDSSAPGWLIRMSLGYIMQLCGEDCISRYAAGTATLEDLERQAEGNLRQGFAVVGVLEDGVDVFFEMISKRVEYIDTSLNQQIVGMRHSTQGSPEMSVCRKRFQDPEFQKELFARAPEFEALTRLYKVAKEVNEFQKHELEKCPGNALSER